MVGKDNGRFRVFDEVKQVRSRKAPKAWHYNGGRIAVCGRHPAALQNNLLPRRIVGMGRASVDQERAGWARCGAEATAQASVRFKRY
jgi:hypothetical protein